MTLWTVETQKTGLGQYLNKALDSSSAFGAMIEGCTPDLEP